MLLPAPKKAAMVIISKMHPDGTEDHAEALPEEEVDEHDAALKAIAEDMMAALHGGSASHLAEALKAFVHTIMEIDEAQDEELVK